MEEERNPLSDCDCILHICQVAVDFNVCVQAMIYASRCVDLQESLNGAQCDEDSVVFFLELLIKVVLQNRLLGSHIITTTTVIVLSMITALPLRLSTL